jgi:hypothetical protein
MEKTLEKITEIIKDYYDTNNHNPEGLINLGRNLSANLYFIEKFRAEKHKAFEATIYSVKMQGYKINSATNEANVKHPELYMLRRHMESAEKVLGMIRSELSWLKSEMNNTNING